MEYTKEDVEKFIKQVADLTTALAAEKTEKDVLKNEVTKLTASLAGLTEANDAHKAKVAKLEAELNTSVASLAKANEDLAVFAKEKDKASRLSLFNDIDVEAAKASELVEKFISLSDDVFAEILSAYPKKNSIVPQLDEVKPEPAVASLPVQPDTTKQTRESASAWLKSNMNSNKEKK